MFSFIAKIPERLRNLRARWFPRTAEAPIPEMVTLLNRAKTTGRPMTIEIDEGGYAREIPSSPAVSCGMVNIVDNRRTAMTSRCVSGFDASGKRIELDQLVHDLPMVAAEPTVAQLAAKRAGSSEWTRVGSQATS